MRKTKKKKASFEEKMAQKKTAMLAQPDRVFVVYDGRNIGWMSIQEAIDWKPSKSAFSKSEKKDLMALVSFLEHVETTEGQAGTARLIANSKNGECYEGYGAYLDDIRSDANPNPHLSLIREAWERHRQEYPFQSRFIARPKVQEVPERQTEKPAHSEEPKRKKQTDGGPRTPIFGFPATLVVRTMGKNGFTKKQVLRVLKHYGVEMSPITVDIKMKDWKKAGDKIAALSKSQLKELKGVAKI